jgi:hypothetical protein
MAKNASGLERAAEAVAAGTSATRMARLIGDAHPSERAKLHETRRRMGLSALACLRVVWAELPEPCRAAVEAAEAAWDAAEEARPAAWAALEAARRAVGAMTGAGGATAKDLRAAQATLAATNRELTWFKSWRRALRMSGKMGTGGRGDGAGVKAQKAARCRAMRLLWGGSFGAADVPAFGGGDAAQVAGMARAATGPDADPVARLALADRLEEAGYAGEAELGLLRDGGPVWKGSWLAERLAALAAPPGA